jgi:hypothetical protein
VKGSPTPICPVLFSIFQEASKPLAAGGEHASSRTNILVICRSETDD